MKLGTRPKQLDRFGDLGRLEKSTDSGDEVKRIQKLLAPGDSPDKPFPRNQFGKHKKLSSLVFYSTLTRA
jgi:hypothetical protein